MQHSKNGIKQGWAILGLKGCCLACFSTIPALPSTSGKKIKLDDWNGHIPGVRDAQHHVSIHYLSFKFLLSGTGVQLKKLKDSINNSISRKNSKKFTKNPQLSVVMFRTLDNTSNRPSASVQHPTAFLCWK